MADQSQILIVQYPASCGKCRSSRGHFVTIESAERSEADGWKFKGSGQVPVQCSYCGDIYDAVRNEVPIQCESYTCPECGGSEHLTCEVKRIDTDGDKFSFEAALKCHKCHRKRTFFSALKELLKITKIELKLNGISIERDGRSNGDQ